MRAIPFDVTAARGIPALITITRGIQVVRFTTWNSPIVSNGDTFVPAPGVNITNMQVPSDGDPASMDIVMDVSPDGLFAPGDGALGYLDGWPITVAIADVDNPDSTYDILPGGNIANVAEARGLMTISVQGPLNRTQRPMTGHYALTGREDLGDDQCKIPIRPAEIPRGAYYVPVTTGLLHVDDAYGRARVGTAGTPEDFCNVYFEALNAGLTGATAPSWNTAPGGWTMDGDVAFVARPSWLRHARGAAIDQFNIQLEYLPDPRATDETWYVLGNIWIASGKLAGYPKIPIRAYDPSTLIITTFLPFATSDIPSGTWMEIAVGCDTTPAMCNARFNNIVNLRAETFVPPANTLG